jgi:hypothetical protein
MDEKQQQTIETLQRELQSVQPTDPLVKEHIDRLNDQLNRYANNPKPNANREDELPALQKSIEEAIESFEGRHPDLTEALRIAINTLVGAGI